MHSFTELADRCTTFTLNALKETNERTINELENSSATSLVKTLQMLQLQKAILAVGTISLFEACLQNGLSSKDGFDEAKKILAAEGELNLKERFEDILLAINVLKHGHGRSYEALVAKAQILPFKIKLPDEFFFYEGDVSEISTLIEVTDEFVQLCGNIIHEVTNVIRRARPDFS